MTRKTTWNDTNKPGCEERAFTTALGASTMGRSRVYISCPFCHSTVKAYLWSLSGSGKRCDCGALFGARGIAYRLSGESD